MKLRRDYQNKGFRNPYFNKKAKGIKSRKTRYFVIIGLILLLTAFYFLDHAEFLKIKNIEISGTEYISQSEIKDLILEQTSSRRFIFFHQSNILFFSKSQAKKKLAENYSFESLKIKKNYPDGIKIELKEEISALIWISGENKYFLDLAGIPLRQLTQDDLVIEKSEGQTDIIRPEISSGNYPVIYDLSNSPVIIGQAVAPKDLVDFVVSLTEKLKKGADFNIAHYELTNPQLKEVILLTKEGWKIYFRTEDPIDQSVGSLFSVLQQEIKNRSTLEYIDLRFGQRVFWK